MTFLSLALSPTAGSLSLGGESSSPKLGAEVSTPKMAAQRKQVSHLQKHIKYYSKFLKGFLNREVVKNLDGELTELAVKAKRCLRHIKKNEKLSSVYLQSEKGIMKVAKFLKSCLTIQAYCLRKVSQDPENESIQDTAEFLKVLERLDKALDRGDSVVFNELLEFITSSVVSVDALPTKKSGSGTACASYFVFEKESEERMMLFKPLSGDAGVFSTIPKGHAFKRQIGAYLLDRSYGSRGNVPLSALGTRQEELGSLQIFRKNQGAYTDLPPKKRLEIAPDALQMTTLLRMRLYDLDGHTGNLLWKTTREGEIQLIPIDLDYTLPHITDEDSAKKSRLRIGWRFAPQLDLPMDKAVLEYIEKLNPDNDAKTLAKLGLAPECIFLMKATTFALQIGAKSSCTTGEILDYLHAPLFKEIFVECLEKCRDEEGLNEKSFDSLMQEALEKGFAALPTIREESLTLFKQAQVALEAMKDASGKEGDEHPAEQAVYIARVLLQAGEYRLAFKIGRQLIEMDAPSSSFEKLLDFFKSNIGVDKAMMLDGCRSLHDSFILMGKEKEAAAISEWIKNVSE
ncbi:MAG: hypothetical protein HYX48_05965 [Chlamydiales bacterium]|nr:hypothetical protein [Chlamydiales bacterium]